MQDHNYYFSGEKIKDVLSNKLGHEEEKLEETKVFLGVAFSRWTSLKRDKSFQSDAEVACFLLDSYERVVMTSAPTKEKPSQVPAPATTDTPRSFNSYERVVMTSAPTKEKPSQVPAPATTDTPRSFNSYERVVMTSLATKEKPLQVIGPAAFGATLSGANRFPYPRLPNGVGMRPVTNLQPPDPRILKMVVFVPPRATSVLTQVRRNAQDAPPQLNAGLKQRVIDHLQLKKKQEEGPTKMELEERCIKMELEERHIEEEQEECCIKMELEEHRIKIEVEERRIETELEERHIEMDLEERRIINQQERIEKEEQEECHLKDEHKERQIKEEQEEHHINSEEVEVNLNGIKEADITGFLLTSVHVKSENDEKKPQSPQPHQGPPLKNMEAQTQTRGSGKQMKTETEDDEGSKKARNSYHSSCLPQNTNLQASDFTETKDGTVDGDNYWQEPLSASEPETEDGKSKNSNLHQSLSESGSETEDSSIDNYNLHRSSSESGSETEDSSIDNYNLHGSSSESGSETEDSSIDNYNLHESSSESGSETESSSSIDNYNLHGPSSESGSETESSSSSSSTSTSTSSVDNYNLHRPSSESGSETEGSINEDNGKWRKPLLNSEPKLVNSGANGKKRFHTPEKPFRCKIRRKTSKIF
uniref:PH domain-containing protein DDB_G0287875 isoform X2 n=1 Tax=Maylandia zebra TaxID=106582 RepID=UPI000D2F5703|nr:PH domain-containing protein DDB_G0287875 isoform X2 [Maylandia zebra]